MEQMTEEIMRDTAVPCPESITELADYIESLKGMQHDYGTCVYAMSMSAKAAFNYIAHSLGVTGFQASFADLDFLKRNRGIRGGFMISKLEDALYPQYNLPGALREWLGSEESVGWLRKEAAIRLVQDTDKTAHPDVRKHWESLASA